MLADVEMTRYNERTLTTPAQVEADIGSRQRGWFMNNGESIADVGAIAWPLTLSGEHYAISVGGPIYRIEPRQAEYASILRRPAPGWSGRPEGDRRRHATPPDGPPCRAALNRTWAVPALSPR